VLVKIAQVQTLMARGGFDGDGATKQILRSARDDNRLFLRKLFLGLSRECSASIEKRGFRG
jgi:hypothetical protein